MPSDSTRAILPEPPPELKQLSNELLERVRSGIRENGPMPFSRFMEMALYEPGLGYYSAGLHKFGQDGDFITAPQLGGVFARCLAKQIEQCARALGSYEILEVGAGTGQLAVDLLEALDDASQPSRYRILERSADLRQQQQLAIERAGLDASVVFEWLDAPPKEPWNGVLLVNEVIDALPVERFQVHGEEIQRLGVTETGDTLSWVAMKASQGLADMVLHVIGHGSGRYPRGYRSEICTMLTPWVQELTAGLSRGCALFMDYGYPRAAYYVPERRDGTLICNYRHRAHDDPFFYPGLQDISAFVDFTALAEAADACALDVSGYTSQSAFLLDCGLEQVLAGMEHLPDRQRIELANEVRRLTMPTEMGEKFQVMALSRGLDFELQGFRTQDHRVRL